MPKTPNPPRQIIRPKIDLDDVRLFSVIARTGSISAAAKELGVVPPTISKRLEELEARLRTRLFVRSHSGVALTERGRAALAKANALDRIAQEFEQVLLASDTRPEGTVTIAAPDLFGSFCVAPHVGEFLDCRPKISLVLDCGFWAQFAVTDPPDILLSVNPDDAKPDHYSETAAMLHYCAYASRSYLEQHGTPTSLSGVVDHRSCENRSLNFQPERWGARPTALRQLVDYKFTTNCGAATVQGLLGGAGIGILPTYMANFVPDDLVMVFDEPVTSVKLWIVHHHKASKTARVGVVLDWLRSIFDANACPWFREDFVHPRDFAAAKESVHLAGVPVGRRRK